MNTFDHEYPTGFDLVVNNDGTASLYVSSKLSVKTYLGAVIGKMVEHYFFPKTEILLALEEMAKNGHDRANFGVRRTLIFTSNSEVVGSDDTKAS